MNDKIKNMALCICFSVLLSVFSLWFCLKGENGYSVSERRELEKFPKLNAETILNGSFMEKFSVYSRDRFPARDGFRSLKAMTEHYVFANTTCNGFYLCDGHIAKTEYPMQQKSLETAAVKLEKIYEKYLLPNGITAYFSLITDKNAFLAKKANVSVMDYEKFESAIRQQLDFAEYIGITDLLSEEDFYYTDQHWRQESIVDIAQRLNTAMGKSADWKYQAKKLDIPFYGTYYSQAALPHSPDEIYYLTNPMLEKCTAISLDTGKPKKALVYDFSLAGGRDPYEMFLCGSQAVITIENPNATSDKRLLMFRDSFGSSLAPLIAEGYAEITLVDIRYIISSELLDGFIDFSRYDEALFIYSTLILNNSSSMR